MAPTYCHRKLPLFVTGPSRLPLLRFLCCLPFKSFHPPPSSPLPRLPLLRQRQVVVVDPVAFELVIPRGAGDIFATVLAPLDVRALAEHVGGHEGADVEAHAVVDVGVPTDRLLAERFPADEQVMRRRLFAKSVRFVPARISTSSSVPEDGWTLT